MKSQRVEALEEVVEDLRYAQDFYLSWRADGADYFKARFDETVAWLEWNPEPFPCMFRSFRRAINRNTYFAIFYVIEPDVTTLVAVVDLRQRPSRIRKLARTRR